MGWLFILLIVILIVFYWPSKPSNSTSNNHDANFQNNPSFQQRDENPTDQLDLQQQRAFLRKQRAELQIKQNELKKFQSEASGLAQNVDLHNDDLKQQYASLQAQFSKLQKQHYALKNYYQSALDELSDGKSSLNVAYAGLRKQFTELQSQYKESEFHYKKRIAELTEERDLRNAALRKLFDSSTKSIPYFSGIMADYLTIGYEELAQKLDWGHSKERAAKVASIRQIRSEAKEQIEQAKEAQYKLEYAFSLFPALRDLVDDEFHLLPPDLNDIPEYDRTRDYLSKEEFRSLTPAQKSQLALDRYINSHNKTNWQIGRDYELSIAYQLQQHGYTVDTYGSYMGLEDLGRDLIAKNGSIALVVQCKYWSKDKIIREKHLAQLYGTTVCYQLENKGFAGKFVPVFVTNIALSSEARRFAKYLNIVVREGTPFQEFPRIKCNIGKDENGVETKIYHLPFDQQYDSVKIDKPGELYARTVQDAERNGFRRAYRWHG